MVDAAVRDGHPHLKVAVLCNFLEDSYSCASCTIKGVDGLSLVSKLNFKIHPTNMPIKTVDSTIHSVTGVVDLPYAAINKVRVVQTLTIKPF